jgi:hypothetical protein
MSFFSYVTSMTSLKKESHRRMKYFFRESISAFYCKIITRSVKSNQEVISSVIGHVPTGLLLSAATGGHFLIFLLSLFNSILLNASATIVLESDAIDEIWSNAPTIVSWSKCQSSVSFRSHSNRFQDFVT